MPKYKVKMILAPLWQIVEVEEFDEEVAIDKAYDEGNWQGNSEYGLEEYSAELIEED